ncbi:MAG: hypothetical protein J3R72DRAFT_487705 [Linnemannia gamsii]|nr:MAG: hypothetical protein J3R72DRAFT_487705 [Linnemannia gamsii]
MGSYNYSRQIAMKAEKNVMGALYSYCMTHMPKWLCRRALASGLRHRPQAGFLTPIEVHGTVVPVISPSEQKARAVFKKQQQSAAAV